MSRSVSGGATRPQGFSLIELMVAMAIGVVVSLIITNLLIRFEDSKRTSTSVNDTTQAATYTSYMLERAVRSAGTGYSQKPGELFGCRINSTSSAAGGALLPSPAPFPDAFANAAAMRRLAPVMIEKDAANNGSEVRGDIITVLSGAGGKSEMPLRASAFGAPPATSFSLPFTGEYKVGDLILIGGDTAAGSRECMIQQVSRINGKVIELGGSYTSATGSTVNFADFSTMSTVYSAPMGTNAPPTPNPPLFQMFAVGDNATLFSFDLLRTAASADANRPQPVADGIVEVRALYGIDTNFDRVVDSWQDPGTAPFRYVDLNDGSAAALLRLRQIVAVRIGLIVRSPLQEKQEVGPTEVALFPGVTTSGGTSLTRTRALTGTERYYRYRAFETTVPLRNMQFAPLP